jgi:RNA polymerase sigma-70 factor, ECF subfamily
MIQEKAKKEQFNRDAMPHLDAIWQTVNWLFEFEQEAEKLTEDIFKEAYHFWDESISSANRKPWMFKILIKVLYKSMPFKFWTPALVDIDDEYEPLPSDKIDLLRSIPDEIVSRAIRNLPVENRLVIVLSFFQKLSYLEIANIIGISKNVVSMIMYMGCVRIREELFKYVMSGSTPLHFANASE